MAADDDDINYRRLIRKGFGLGDGHTGGGRDDQVKLD